MKQIFRMALVFALAGATLVYTGCTKDYDEDINNLKKEITDLQTNHAADVAALQSSINSLESAYKSADAAIKELVGVNTAAISDLKTKLGTAEANINDLKTKANALEAALASAKTELEGQISSQITALKTDLEAQISTLENAVNATIADLQNDVNTKYEATIALLTQAKAEIDAAMAVISNELKGLEFIPEFYTNGVEAAEYVYAAVAPKYAKALAKELKDGQYTFPVGAKAEAAKGTDYSMGKLAYLYFHLNPSSFDVAKAEWKLYFAKDLATKANAWAPSVVATEKVHGGDIEVTYTVSNAELLAPEGKVSVMNLWANLVKEGYKSVTSNNVALVPAVETLNKLVFAKGNEYTTANGKDLYTDVKPTVNNRASVKACYSEPLDLKGLVNVAVTASDGTEKEMTLAELKAGYPSLSFKAELVSYYIGENDTDQAMFGDITEGVFTPCYVNEEGKSVKAANKSSIGRKPLVLLTLSDGTTPILYGYYMIEIVAEPVIKPDTIVKEFDVKNFGSFPFICAGNAGKSTSWDEFSGKILSALDMDYKQFIDTFKVVDVDGVYNYPFIKMWQGADLNAKLFVKNDKGDYVAASNKGKMVYSVDESGTGVNDKFTWSWTMAEAATFADPQDVYVRFERANENYKNGLEMILYIKFSAKIDAKPTLEYGKKNATYWYNGGAYVANNVTVPTTGREDVTVFVKDLNDNFEGNKVVISYAAGTSAAYSALPVAHKFMFAKDQYTFGNAKLTVSADQKSLLAGTTTIATITDAGVVTYLCNAASKELLNAYGQLPEYDSADALRAAVTVATYYDKCNIEANTYSFDVHFVKPIYVVNGDDANLKDAVPGGDVIKLGKLFKAKDWQGFDIFTLDDNGNAKVGTYKTAANSTINWFTYYGFSSIKVDIENILTNQTGETKLLSVVNPAAKVTVQRGNYVDEDNTVSINNNIYNLNNYVINYQNNNAVAKEFTLTIPVEITYAWGVAKVNVNVTVNGTF